MVCCLVPLWADSRGDWALIIGYLGWPEWDDLLHLVLKILVSLRCEEVFMPNTLVSSAWRWTVRFENTELVISIWLECILTCDQYLTALLKFFSDTTVKLIIHFSLDQILFLYLRLVSLSLVPSWWWWTWRHLLFIPTNLVIEWTVVLWEETFYLYIREDIIGSRGFIHFLSIIFADYCIVLWLGSWTKFIIIPIIRWFLNQALLTVRCLVFFECILKPSFKSLSLSDLEVDHGWRSLE